MLPRLDSPVVLVLGPVSERVNWCWRWNVKSVVAIGVVAAAAFNCVVLRPDGSEGGLEGGSTGSSGTSGMGVERFMLLSRASKAACSAALITGGVVYTGPIAVFEAEVPVAVEATPLDTIVPISWATTEAGRRVQIAKRYRWIMRLLVTEAAHQLLMNQEAAF